MHCQLSAPDPAAGHRRPTPLPETPGSPQASLGQSPVGSLLLSPGSWCTRFCLCPPRVCFPVLWKFWRLYGGVDGDLLQEASATPRSAAPEPPPLRQATVDPNLRRRLSNTQRQVWLSLSRVSCCAQISFEPAERLWQVWGLILNVISPLLLSCCGFSFALGHGISFFGGIQHSPVDGCSAVSCNFGVLTGEDKRMSEAARRLMCTGQRGEQ